MEKSQKTITWLTAVLVIALALAAFTLSYESLRGLAKVNSLPYPALFPLVVEGFIIVASLAWLRNSINQTRSWYPVALIGLATIVSVIFNVLHAPPAPLARIMYGVPPIALLLSFELLMSQLRENLQPASDSQEAQAIADLQAQLDEAQARRQSLQDQLATLQGQNQQLKQRETIPATLGPLGRDMLRLIAGDEITQTEIATRHEISESKVSRLKAELNGVSK